MKKVKQDGPRVLILDIETAPILAYAWGLFDQTIGLNQIKSDWHLLSWSAKWLGDKPHQIMYMDQRKAKNIEDDKELLKEIWKLIDEADVLITQNGKNFDAKKLNARFILNGFKPPSSYKHIDTLLIAKRHFGFTSNKLAYMSDKLCTKYKKLTHEKYAGFDLWKGCLEGDPKAWQHMEKYNKYDVLSLEELYTKLIPWDNQAPNFNLYKSDPTTNVCKCGSKEFSRNGHFYGAGGKYQRYSCKSCGAESRSKVNLFSAQQRKKLRVNTTR